MMGRSPVFKVILMGEGGVGKTSLVVRYTENRFDQDMKMTIGVNFASKKIEVEGRETVLMLWDLGGQPRFHDVVSDYFRGASLCLAVFDVTRSYTLDRLDDWISRAQEQSKNCKFLIVGNKLDEREEGTGVSISESRAFASKYKARSTEVSAKTGGGVVELFEFIASELSKS